ncbi:MAG: hypothetical protein Q8M83_04350 [bacterium]|nr:hypothetical protein [bacterium]
MFNFRNLLSLNYWFSLQAPLLNKASFYVWLAICLMALVLAIGLNAGAARWRGNPPLIKFLRRVSHPLIFLAVVGFIFLFFRQESAYFLSARFWLALVGAGFIAWTAIILVRFLKSYKQDLARLAQDREFRKYLPR